MRTILVVDDDKIIVELLSEYLKEMGYKVMTADDGDTGLKAVMKHPEIELVVLDLKMPRMDGFETYRRMKTIRPDLRVLISSTVTTAYMQGLYAMGVDGVLTKPYDLKDLHKAITDIIPPLNT